MAEYTPVSKINYDLFKKNYDPKLPYNKQSETILQKYNEDLFNKYSSIASEEPKLGLFEKLGSGLENLFSAYGAEMPQVPNLSLGYNVPTFDLGTGKGITNTSSALPFRSMVDMQEAANQDLVQQLIEENQARANPFVRPNMLDIAGGIVPGGVTDINKLPYSGVGDMGYTTPRTISDQNKVLGQTFTEPKKSNGIMDAIMSFVIPGYNFIKNLGSGKAYEQFTPGGTIRDGIYSIGGVNVPVSSYGGDFYDPTTGLNRFDRARQMYEQTGKVTDLFKSSRTGKEFFEKMREKKAAERKALEETAAAKLKYKTYTSGGGDRDPGPRFDNTGGDIGSKGAADRFSNTSGSGRTGY